jgi:hypothetical protein
VTEFGPDISSYQHGVNVRALIDKFILMKATEDVGYVDADYPGWLAQAKASGKIPIAYHFIGPSSPSAQAAHLAAHIIDRNVPVMVDFENEGAFHPNLAQLLALNDAIAAAGLRVKLNYLPRWMWSQLGSPDLTALTARGIGLVSSAYPGGQGYPGDGGSGWQPYGGVTPLLWQFTDVAVDGGQRVGDMNAYRGTIEQLAVFLGTSAPSPTIGDDMTPDEHTMLAQIHQSAVDFANWQFFSPPGREQVQGTHAWRMQSTLDNTTAIKAELDAVKAAVAALAPAAPPAIDVNALAAALAPHLANGATPDQVAAAVVQHLASAFAKG